MSDDTLTIELKGRPQIKIPFFCNFMIFSNDEDCLYLTKEARRYLIIAIKHSQDAINEKRYKVLGGRNIISDIKNIQQT